MKPAFEKQIPHTQLRVRSIRSGLTGSQARTLGAALHYVREESPGVLVGLIPDSQLARDTGVTSRTIRNHRRALERVPWVLTEGTPGGVIWSVNLGET